MSLAEARAAVMAGHGSSAVAMLGRLIAQEPGDHELRYWMAGALTAAGDAAGAASALSEASTLHALALARAMGADLGRCRTDGDYANTIATTLYANHYVATASAVWSMALALGRFDTTLLLNYGLALLHQGRIEDSVQALRMAADSSPNAAVGQFQMFSHVFVEDSGRRFADAATAWARRHAPSLPEPPFQNRPSKGRKLRLGYVAPNFAGSQLRQFVAPMFENHDRGAVEVFLYPAKAETETGWPAWIKIRPIGHLSDAAAAELIRGDRIDVLSDLWGHTAGSRLSVFALRAAPVQVGWLNFVQTTGLPQMDYVLHADSEGVPADQYTETVWPIGPVFTAFRPAAARAEPGDTPALASGGVMFGSFNHPAKLSDDCLDAWAAVLRRTPGSRLTLKYRYFVDPVLQRIVQARFAGRGVEPDRVVFQPHSTGAEYLAAFGQIDLALDAWPAPGSTTTLEALSNGVPVLALAGADPTIGSIYARTLLQAAGLPELIATSPEDFVDKAAALAADLGALNALRARVRPGLEAGPCCDERGFTRRLEGHFRQMFELWAEKASQGSAGALQARHA